MGCESLVLPPKVLGKIRNVLELSLLKVIWKTKSFHEICVKIIWWGQTEGISCEGITVNSSCELKTIRYEIRTSQNLWWNYLASCEPLRIEFFSAKTQNKIGFCEIKIPPKVQSHEVSADILSIRNFKLGEIIVRVVLQSKDQPDLKMRIQEVKGILQTSKKMNVNKDADKENLEIIGKKKKISFREPKPKPVSTLKRPLRRSVSAFSLASSNSNNLLPSVKSATSTTSVSSKSVQLSSAEASERSELLNFLRGKQMSQVEEIKVLEKFAAISPSQSLIESLNSEPYDPPRKLGQFPYIKIVLSQVELNNIGQRETQNFMNKVRLQRFIFKCAATSKSFREFEDFCVSSVFETAPRCK